MLSLSSTNMYNWVSPINKMPSWYHLSAYSRHMTSTSLINPLARSAPYEPYIRSAATGIANFLKSSQKMQHAAQALTQTDSSALQARTTESSDSKKVTASASGGAAIQIYKVKVDSIATSQVNSGTYLSKASPSVVDAGVNEFNITIGGKTTKVSAAIAAGDTNEQALIKLRDAINKANTGVKASIITDEQSGQKKKLELMSDKTGTDHAFEVEDVTGNAMSATGVTNATEQASNASYSINGADTQTSQSNSIVLEKGKVTATLAAPTTEEVTIEVKPDSDKIISQVKGLVESYNTMYSRLKEAGGVMDPSVRRGLDSVFSSSAYERFGITRNTDGTLKLHEEQLRHSLSANFEQTSRAIGGRYGLAERLSAAADRFNQVPAISLLNQQARQVQQLAIYQQSMQLALATPATGWFLNMLY